MTEHLTERYRKIKCPDMDDRYYWQAHDAMHGETLECADVAQLLKRMVDGTGSWTLRRLEWDSPELSELRVPDVTCHHCGAIYPTVLYHVCPDHCYKGPRG